LKKLVNVKSLESEELEKKHLEIQKKVLDKKEKDVIHTIYSIKKTGRRGLEEKMWNKNVSLHFLVLYAPCFQ